MSPTITGVTVRDIRYPTSDTLKGSDAFHRSPDYSCPYVTITTDDPQLTGHAVVFTIGAGTDWLVYGIRDLAKLVVGMRLEQFTADTGSFHRRLVDHHQLRWLGDAGVYSMAVGGVVNALWDLAAKSRGLPMWRYLCELPPSDILKAINWRYLGDALRPELALQLLHEARGNLRARIEEFATRGPEAYSTAAWSGLTDDEVRAACRVAVERLGMRSVKAKVGLSESGDIHRLTLIRKAVGPDVGIRVDANQVWSVDQAISWMAQLRDLGILWIEEPTHPDDVDGYRVIQQALKPYHIKVAGGEHTKNPVIFKQLLRSGIDYCQVDAARMAGLNDVLATILLARRFQVPVCPHGGGIGLCNYIQHLGAYDQVAVSGTRTDRVVEWIDFLGEAMVTPVRVEGGHYVLPESPGWGIELTEGFLDHYDFERSPFWKSRRPERVGVQFEA